MRVITGSSRGAKLTTLEGMETRPTADRVKEAIFNMIQFEIEGRNVLDLFAGSGQLGIETLSRGAATATFVDLNSEAVQVIKQNLIHTHLYEKAKVLSSDFASFLQHAKPGYDIILMDPPYGKGLIEAALPLAAPLVPKHGVIVCEAAVQDSMPETAGEFRLVQKNNYGKASVGIYRHVDAIEE